MEKACEDSREYVLQMFESDDFDWMDQPIVACSVSLYADPEFNDIFMPAEIGLCAFSLRKGVMDNFGRLIDIGNLFRIYLYIFIPHPIKQQTYLKQSNLLQYLGVIFKRGGSSWLHG